MRRGSGMDNLGRPARLPRPVNACLPRSRGEDRVGMREDRAKEGPEGGGSGRARGRVGKVKAGSGDGRNWYERSRWRGRPDPQLRSPITTLKSFLTESRPTTSSPAPLRHSSPDAFFYLGKIGDIKKLLICGPATNRSERTAIVTSKGREGWNNAEDIVIWNDDYALLVIRSKNWKPFWTIVLRNIYNLIVQKVDKEIYAGFC